MDLFEGAQHVRLRNREHGTYLHADDDGHGVSLSPHQMSTNTVWAVHRYPGDSRHVLLHTATSGRYLSTTDASAELGYRGFRAVQRNYNEHDEEDISWMPVRALDRDEILLLHHVVHVGFYGYLRANGNAVTIDTYQVSISNMWEWVVERIPVIQIMPSLPPPTMLHLPVLLPPQVVMFQGHGEGSCGNNHRMPGIAIPPPAQATPPNWRTEIRRHWARGVCNLGAACSFAHGNEDLHPRRCRFGPGCQYLARGQCFFQH